MVADAWLDYYLGRRVSDNRLISGPCQRQVLRRFTRKHVRCCEHATRLPVNVAWYCSANSTNLFRRTCFDHFSSKLDSLKTYPRTSSFQTRNEIRFWGRNTLKSDRSRYCPVNQWPGVCSVSNVFLNRLLKLSAADPPCGVSPPPLPLPHKFHGGESPGTSPPLS